MGVHWWGGVRDSTREPLFSVDSIPHIFPLSVAIIESFEGKGGEEETRFSPQDLRKSPI